jgi:hypothetical protein
VEIVVGIVVCLHNFTSAAATWIAILLRRRSERMSAGLAIGTLSRIAKALVLADDIALILCMLRLHLL